MVDDFDAKTKHSSGAVIPAQEMYVKEYSDEMKLNNEFHKFVANFQLAYQGPNEARDQIGAKYCTCELRYMCMYEFCPLALSLPSAYSDFLDKDYSEPGDEYLPLGPAFQVAIVHTSL